MLTQTVQPVKWDADMPLVGEWLFWLQLCLQYPELPI